MQGKARAMLTTRRRSSSDSRRRRRPAAYRVAQQRGRASRALRIVLPLGVATFALAVGWYAHGAPTLDPGGAPTPLPIALGVGPQPAGTAPARAEDAPSPAPTAAPTAVPTPAPVAVAEPAGPLLPGHRVLAYYGNPLAQEMGILGELPPEQMLRRLTEQVAAYAAADPTRPVLPALELVTPAAQGWPGEDGLYRARMKPEVIDQVAGWAEANHALLILDVQIGLSNVPQEVEALMPYLRRPYVHLALDPEFAIPSGHIPGEVVGTLDGAAIDGAIHTLSGLVVSERLPPKILIVHRFTDSMITNAWEIAPDPHVQVVVTMDGFGEPDLKLAQYREYVHDQRVQFAGIKLFYHHDVPLLAPPQVVGLDPSPDLVIYQ